ncbi:peptide ABC transporter substrate-binding protein [uncultured Alsobacter sp.]|uniref:peptide ABC transporter substrate-binding protein n=1 Tax=uncultured Alsobacter sp. TaxID=1748258 RepID=UPI0025EFE5F8|nr:peptide ABC transporter substrate-binding protein [uncultured Alsobacter sp.]
MNENEIRGLVDSVKDGRMDRRAFIQRMVAVGLSAPIASQILVWNGVAMAQSKLEYKPTKRGGGGPLKVLWWQGPTLLNPHFAVGTKEQDAARIFYEPLANWDPDGNLIPVLAAEIPTRENGGLAADGKSVVWKLKPGIKWHDGKPVTADDMIFNWQFAKDPATASVTIGTYRDVEVEKIDDLSVRVKFKIPTPFWADAFVGTRGSLIPKHLFEAFSGAKSREAPANLSPVGTGPYKFVEFKPGDLVKGSINMDYHKPNMPHFDSIEMKGGGDAASAARAVLQTGEYDYGWNIQVEEDVIARLEKGGKGKALISKGANIEFILLNHTDPWTEVDGERASLKTKHPTLLDPAVRKALQLLVDRKGVEEFIYGRAGIATANFLNAPERFNSKNMTFEFNVDKANKILDDGGWKRGSDGIREKDGKKLKYVFQTSINGPRQKTQAIIKQACQKAGIDLELKSVVASVYFSSDVANPDTYTKFYCDLEMYTTTMTQPDPTQFMLQFASWEAATKENKWQGQNISRWSNKEYDETYKASVGELDPVKRAAMFIKMNDLIIADNAIIPVVYRPRLYVINEKLRAPISGWDTDTGSLEFWYREA